MENVIFEDVSAETIAMEFVVFEDVEEKEADQK